MGNHTDMRAATSDGTRFHRCDRIRQQLPLRTDSIPRRSDTIDRRPRTLGCGQRPSDRSASCGTSEGTRDVRPARHRLSGRAPTLQDEDEHGSSDANRKANVVMTPSRRCLHLRAGTSRCPLQMVSERTPHEEGGSANRLRRRTRATPRGSEGIDDGNIGDRDGTATDLRGSIRRMLQTDEEHVGFPRRLGSRARSETGTARSDVSPTHERSWENNGWDGHVCNGMQARRIGGAGRRRDSVGTQEPTRRRPRRGTRPREGRPTNARIRCALVRTHSRSKASRDRVPPVRQERQRWKRS